jgi:DNA-binding transcriptional LysR family regulator
MPAEIAHIGAAEITAFVGHEVGCGLDRVENDGIHHHRDNQPGHKRVDAGTRGDRGIDRQEQCNAGCEVGDGEMHQYRAGIKRINATSGLRFEHNYFSLEAAASGLGVAIGSFPLVEADLKSGRLVAPFGFVASDRFYCLLTVESAASVGKIKAFRQWLLGLPANGKPNPGRVG